MNKYNVHQRLTEEDESEDEEEQILDSAFGLGLGLEFGEEFGVAWAYGRVTRGFPARTAAGKVLDHVSHVFGGILEGVKLQLK